MNHFQLKRFVSQCKGVLTNYLKKIKATSRSRNEFKLRKKLIITFLKEYVDHNNDKYTRSQFNITFIKEFITQILPEKYGRDIGKMPVDQIKQVLTDFIQKLSMEKVLNKRIKQNAIRIISKEIQAENIPRKADQISDQADIPSYSEEELHRIEDENEDLTSDFLETDLIKNLTETQRDYVKDITHLVALNMYSYHSCPIEKWDRDSLRDLCLNILPRKASMQSDFFTSLPPVLTQYFKFLQKKGILSQEQVINLAQTLTDIKDEMIDLAEKPNNWGIAKSFVMGAYEEGINMEDDEEFNAYLNKKRLMHNLSILDREKGKKIKFNHKNKNNH